MYKHIAVPVDLAHADQLEKALSTAAQLTRLWSSRLTLVAVTGPAPGVVAHNPAEFEAKAHEFCAEVSGGWG